MKKILIIGTGSWGTAIAQVLADNNQEVVMYGINQQEVDDINLNRCNSKFFSKVIQGKYLSEKIRAFSDLKDALISLNNEVDIIILAIPTNCVYEALMALNSEINTDKDLLFINLAKGYDDSYSSMFEIYKTIFKNKENYYYYSLLGPSHAEEVIQRKLTCINLIPEKKAYLSSLIDLFTNDYFKVHLIYDLQAAEFYSSVKNVYALMSGILDGLGYGQNARAALLTYSLFEMNKFREVLKFDDYSLFGLSGIGDLVVTCYSDDSRNFTAGKQIGKLNSYDEFSKYNNKTVEGIRATRFIYNIMDKIGLDLIIIKTMYNILYKHEEPKKAIDKMFDLFNHMI